MIVIARLHILINRWLTSCDEGYNHHIRQLKLWRLHYELETAAAECIDARGPRVGVDGVCVAAVSRAGVS